MFRRRLIGAAPGLSPMTASLSCGLMAALLLSFGSHALAQTAVGTGQIVVKIGDTAPGLPAGTTFSKLGVPTVNANGEVAFVATITGPGVISANNSMGNDSTVWAGKRGALRLVAREGSAAPGTGAGVVFASFDDSNFSRPIITANGSLAFAATLRGTGVTSASGDGIWHGKPGNIRLVARRGNPAPDTEAGTVFYSFIFNSPGWTASDVGVAFQASLSGPAIGSLNNAGIWAGLPGQVRLIARRDQVVSSLPGTRITSLTNADPLINKYGETLFRADINNIGNTSNPREANFLATPGNLMALAVTGQSASEVGAGVTLGSMESASRNSLNDSGTASLAIRLQGGGLTVSSNQSLWRADTSGRDLIARATNTAPGTSAGYFRSFSNSAINGQGIVALTADLSGAASEWSLWVGSLGDLELLAQPEMSVPTPIGNVLLQSIATGPLINQSGEVAFSGVIASPKGNAIFIGTPGDLFPAVISGQPLDLGSDGIHVPGYIHTGFRAPNTGNQDGRPSGFSDNGQVAFHAELPKIGDAIILAPALKSNKLTNGDFETGAISPWSTLSGFSASNANTHGGRFAGRFAQTAAGTTWQQVPVTAGRSYDIEGWVNLPSRGTLSMRVQWRGSTNTTTVIRQLTSATAGWTRIGNASALVAPAGATAARVEIAVQSLQSACFVDDLVFSER